MAAEQAPRRLRTGRKVGRTVYAQLGPDPADTDPLVGVVDTPALAALVAAAVTHYRTCPLPLPADRRHPMTQSYPEHDPNDLSEQPEVDTAAAVAEEPDVAGEFDPVDDDADAPDDHDDYGAEDEPDQGEDSDPSEVEGSH